MAGTAVGGPLGDAVHARVEQAALDLFSERGFDVVTSDEVTDAAGISRRTFFRCFAAKADAVWGDFAGHVRHLAQLLEAADPAQPVLRAICAAYVEANAYPADRQELLRQRMQLILTEPALQAHSQVRYADVDRVVAEHVARRTRGAPSDLLPRLVATTTRAAAMTAFEVWPTRRDLGLANALHGAFDELAAGLLLGGWAGSRLTAHPSVAVRSTARRHPPRGARR
ncbi:TetR family transcriptional regulator [uncultured Modestobacter sp.]|uniref:acyl-CoA-like ligand-binding transcription factor n=1 Tax=uncultured Modestobacter sp. TaxID=380048 RepID=UPI002613F69A|nr:TetR family transcriptional regulator [uncultured Modestobacter sp.]